ncbi:MAG: hypothetical protein V4495_29660 [Pseudomonadota bacterium]
MKNKITETTVPNNSKITADLPGWHEDSPYFDCAYLGLMNMLMTMGAVANTHIAWIKGRHTNAH